MAFIKPKHLNIVPKRLTRILASDALFIDGG